MIAGKKKHAILQWVACYEQKLDGLWDLENGNVFLKLLSRVDKTIDVESVPPSEWLRTAEDHLRAIYDFLPARISMQDDGEKELELATVAVLVLSALFVHAASCSGRHSVAPVMNLEPRVQEEIRELLQIVTMSRDVLHDLQEHIRAPSEEEGPTSVKRRLKKRKSQSFTYTPSMARTPVKRVTPSPQQPSYSVAMRSKDRQIRQLRRQLSEEETKTSELEQEVAHLKECSVKNGREISHLKAMIRQLNSDPDASLDARREVECLKCEVSILRSNLQSVQATRRDYDDLIRENDSLKSRLEELEKTKLQVKELKESVLEALAQKSAIESKLSDVIQQNGALEAVVEEKESEIKAYREFFNSEDIPAQSPRTPIKNPPSISCFAEFCQVELEQTKEQLQETAKVKDRLERDILQLQQKEVQGNMEISRLQETVAQLEFSNKNLGNDLSQATEQLKMLSETLECKTEAEEQLRCKFNERELHINDLNEKLADASLKIRVLEVDNAALKRDLQESIEVCNLEKAKVHSLQNDMSQLHVTAKELKEENSALKHNLEDRRDLLDRLGKAEQERDRLSSELNRLEGHLETAVLKHKDLTRNFEQSSRFWDEARRLLENKNVALARDLKEALEQYSVEKTNVSSLQRDVGDLREALEKSKRAAEENEALRRNLEDFIAKKACLENQIEMTTLAVEQLNENYADYDVSNNAVAGDRDKLREDLEESRLLIGNLETSITDLRINLAAAEQKTERAIDTVAVLKIGEETVHGMKEASEERDRWKQKHEELKVFLERQLEKLTSEMKKTMASSNADVKKLKMELLEQRAKIKRLEDEKDTLALENQRLRAEVKGRERQPRDMRKCKEDSKRASSALCNNTVNFKAPAVQRETKRESHRANLIRALSSSIFAENRFVCDEEQDVLFETGLWDTFGSRSRAHLKSFPQEETQTGRIPPTPLKEATLNEENVNRRRSMRISRSVEEHTAETPKKRSSKGTPSRLGNLMKWQLHRD